MAVECSNAVGKGQAAAVEGSWEPERTSLEPMKGQGGPQGE